MNRDRFAGSCKQLVGKVQAQWGKLIDDASAIDAGVRAQFAGRIQQRYGDAKERADLQLKDFLARNRNWNLTRRQ